MRDRARGWLGLLASLLVGPALVGAGDDGPAPVRVAAFSAEVTPPLGHPLMGGGIMPAQRIDDPLYAHGFVLLGEGKPIVFVAVDWCEIRNDAYERWRSVLAAAAGTDAERVLVAALHQHDAPIADLTAQKLLEEHKAKGSICDAGFHERSVQRVATALKDGLKQPRRITHLGLGQAKVERVASNRRYVSGDQRLHFDRTSASRSDAARQADEGLIDPWLKTLSFWDGDQPVLALSAYAVHPMSYYGKGGVSADFVGLARKRRHTDDPKVLQIYVSGCSGNVTAGKYNDGAAENRAVLADRIYQAMTRAWRDTKRRPLPRLDFRSTKLRLEPRDDAGFTVADLQKRLTGDAKPFGQCLAALGLSWRRRADAGATLDVPVLDWGAAALVLAPAESYVEFQLAAQKMRPGDFVMVAGYGECAPGYIPTEKHIAERDANLRDWHWVAPGSEARLLEAIKRVLVK
jgi:hypothetical protein